VQVVYEKLEGRPAMGTESVVSAGTIPARLWGATRVGSERAPTVCGLRAQFVRCFALA
jgi:hypothetical protein